MLDDPTSGDVTPDTQAADDPATVDTDAPSSVDIAAVEHEFAQIDEALARLDAGDLDAAEAITDALVGPELVIDLTDEGRSTTDEGTPPVDTAQVPTSTSG